MPELLVDVDTIGANTEAVVRLLRERGLDLVAVTKGCMGEPRVGAAMLSAGAVALADSRDQNLRLLRADLPQAELHRINLPSSAGVFERGDLNYISSWANAEALVDMRRSGSEPRGSTDHPVRVVLYVETGDEREGVPADGLLEVAERIVTDARFEFEGIATNYACLRGTPEGMAGSAEAVAAAARDLRTAGIQFSRVSGGNSSLLWLVARGEGLPAELTELRCGEALLLGHDALRYETLPGCHEDGCRIRAEVVEEYTKRAAGGSARRLVLAAGHQDMGRGMVRFLEPGLEEVGRSAGYLVVEAREESGRMPVGMMIDMIPDYEALSTAWMSPHVDVKLVES